MFAVCFSRDSDTDAWVETLAMLAYEVGLEQAEDGVERFKPGLTVVWSAFVPVAESRPYPASTS